MTCGSNGLRASVSSWATWQFRRVPRIVALDAAGVVVDARHALGPPTGTAPCARWTPAPSAASVMIVVTVAEGGLDRLG